MNKYPKLECTSDGMHYYIDGAAVTYSQWVKEKERQDLHNKLDLILSKLQQKDQEIKKWKIISEKQTDELNKQDSIINALQTQINQKDQELIEKIAELSYNKALNDIIKLIKN